MSDDNMRLLLQLAIALGVIAGQVVTAMLAWLSTRRVASQVEAVAVKADVAAAEVVEVKRTLAAQDDQLEKIKSTGEKNHGLLNGGHGLALQTIATQARRIADRDGRPEDIRAAEAAERKVAEHEARQAQASKAKDRAAARTQERDLARAQAQERDRPLAAPDKP